MRERESQRVRRARSRMRRARRRTTRERGFTITQLLITVAIIAVVAAFSVMGIASARTSMRVQQSAREFAGYVEKVRADAIRRHATASVQILSQNATSYLVTMDFNYDGVPETRTVQLQPGAIINHNPVTLTFDWRGRLMGPALSLGFEGPSNGYAIQLDVTGSGDVTIGEESLLDDDVPTVSLNKTLNGTEDTAGSIGTAPPPPPGTAPPPTLPPGTAPPPTLPPGTAPPPTQPPGTTPPPTQPPGTTPPPPSTAPPPTQPPGTTPPPTQPPSPPPSTPPVLPSCTMTFSDTAVSLNACNNQGRGCGSKTITATLLNYPSGTTVTTSGTVPGNLAVSISSQGGGVFSITIAAKSSIRTSNTVTFSAGTSCGTQGVGVTTK